MSDRIITRREDGFSGAHRLRLALRAVFYQEDEVWFAHCLEMGVIGDGHSRAAALESLSAAIVQQVTLSIAHNNPDNLFMPADSELFVMYAAGKDVADAEFELDVIKSPEIVIESLQARDFTLA